MISNVEKYKKDLDNLLKRGEALYIAMLYESAPEAFSNSFKENKMTEKKQIEWKKTLPSFGGKYQSWYSEARALVKQLLPDRLADFIKLYEKTKPRKVITNENYSIEDYLQGLSVTRGWEKEKVVGQEAAIPRFRQQISILESVKAKFESSLFEIKQLVQADLFDSELETASELLKNGFKRPAGAVAGVVLEKHLNQILESHSISIPKNKTLGGINELLKKNNVIEIPDWRFIQHLTDLRNLCDHDTKREPTEEQVQDLIDGVGKVTKTIF